MSFQRFLDFEKKQAEFRLRMVRIAVAFVLFFIFCWMNWWVMPYVAIVRFDEKEAQIPKTCYLLMGQEDNKILGLRIIQGIEYGWDGVPAAWPYMLAGMIPALGIGYCIGELARRKFAIDAASKEAVSLAKKHESDADLAFTSSLKLLQKLDHDVLQFESEKKGFESQRLELQLEQKHFEEGVRKIESGELIRAKSSIERLEKKIKRLQEKLQKKPVDANQNQG